MLDTYATAVCRGDVKALQYFLPTSPHNKTLLDNLPDDIVAEVARHLYPHDRLALARTATKYYALVWPTQTVWHHLANDICAGTLGSRLQSNLTREAQRRNADLLSPKQRVLKTVYGLCVGCLSRRSGDERITGLALCTLCLKNNRDLGVTSKTNAKREYKLNDYDLGRLGERSAVIEFDDSASHVRRIYFYHRALLQRAIVKYGGVEQYERHRRKLGAASQKRRRTIERHRQERRRELDNALGKLGLAIGDAYAACVVSGRKRTMLLPWEVEIDNAAHDYLRGGRNDVEAGNICRAAEVKVFFKDMTKYVELFGVERRQRPGATMPELQAAVIGKSLTMFFRSRERVNQPEFAGLPALLKEVLLTPAGNHVVAGGGWPFPFRKCQ